MFGGGKYTVVYSFGDPSFPKPSIDGARHGLIHATIGVE